MEKNYEVIQLNNSPYAYLVIATSYESPLADVEKIYDEYRIVGDKNILFDMTLINGRKSNRYICYSPIKSASFMKRFEKTNNVGEEIKQVSRNYFMQHPQLVDDSVVPKAMKYLIKKGALV